MKQLICPFCKELVLPVEEVYRATKSSPYSCKACNQQVYPEELKRRLFVVFIDTVIAASLVILILYPTWLTFTTGALTCIGLVTLYLKYHPLAKA
jgi:hypothetical protein